MEPIYINKISSFDYTLGTYNDDTYAKIVEPDYKEIIANANMRRRMSRIIKMGVASALTCLDDKQDLPLDAIITATGWGCLDDTEKFLKDLIKYDEGALNPTTFIQSTFNTVGAQIALLLGAKPYNMTYVHRGLSVESALLDAILFLQEGKQNILVGGFDELTPTSFTILKRLGVYKDCLAGEGANFFLLSRESTSSTMAQLVDIHICNLEPTSELILCIAQDFLTKHGLKSSDLNLLMLGRNKDTETEVVYDKFIKKLSLEDIPTRLFKESCGEYPTAVAYGLAEATHIMSSQYEKGSHALILNIQKGMGFSMILIKR